MSLPPLRLNPALRAEDFASSYAVNESLELTFEAINLTDEFEHQTFDTLMLPTLYHHTGRNFIFGARYSF